MINEIALESGLKTGRFGIKATEPSLNFCLSPWHAKKSATRGFNVVSNNLVGNP